MRTDAATSTSAYSEERALILAYIRDYAAEFGDQASLKSSVTRGLRLLERSGLARERWVEKLYEAHGLTRERDAAIGWTGQPRQGRLSGASGKWSRVMVKLDQAVHHGPPTSAADG
jgi:hypothetical protein